MLDSVLARDSSKRQVDPSRLGRGGIHDQTTDPIVTHNVPGLRTTVLSVQLDINYTKTIHDRQTPSTIHHVRSCFPEHAAKKDF